jgi:proline iminopeptidase
LIVVALGIALIRLNCQSSISETTHLSAEQVYINMNAQSFLYPNIQPFDQRTLDVGDGHTIYVEQCGRPDGVPVVVLHGGPGGGCSPFMRRFFDPAVYRVILFDQRGCGKSKPHASVEANSTWHLIRDIEHIRTLLNINKWIVFGGSWGSTLALLYAQSHPSRAAFLALRGIFLMTQRELDWFYGGGAGNFWPQEWSDFVSPIPRDERHDLIEAYGKRLFCDDISVRRAHAQSWAVWENRLAALASTRSGLVPNADFALAFSRIENHYFRNKGFLSSDTQILSNMEKIAHIPGHIVHGRYDMICPVVAAYDLAAKWPEAELNVLPDAGHALSEPPIARNLLGCMNGLRGKFEALKSKLSC